MFLLAAASFCVGIAFRETNIQIAFGFYLAGLILGLLLAPNKMYCITYSSMGMYLLIVEFAYDKLMIIQNPTSRRSVSWIIKYVVFNLLYLPAVIFLPKLFFAGVIDTRVMLVMVVGGQGAILIFDMAYQYFQRFIWGKFRHNLKL